MGQVRGQELDTQRNPVVMLREAEGGLSQITERTENVDLTL